MADPAEPAVRVLIADDHPIFRDGLATLLDPLPGIAVVGGRRTESMRWNSRSPAIPTW